MEVVRLELVMIGVAVCKVFVNHKKKVYLGRLWQREHCVSIIRDRSTANLCQAHNGGKISHCVCGAGTCRNALPGFPSCGTEGRKEEDHGGVGG